MTTGITLKDYAKTTLTQQQQRNESENELHRSSTCLQRRGAPAQIAPWEISDMSYADTSSKSTEIALPT